MPSDYARISEENGRKYGTDIGRIGPTLLGNRYADRTHFVFELLQNAEDALHRRGGADGSGRVRFELAGGSVRFSHFGLPFTPDDVRAVCGIIEGTKEDDLIAIGRFGIGFKSVYAVTDLPQIHSGDEHFAVHDYVHPTAAAPIPLAHGETIIALPLQDGDEDAGGEVAGQFERLGDERTLLFLREIDEIEWSVEDGPYGYCRRDETAESEGVRRVKLLSAMNGGDPVEEVWLVFSREVHHEGTSAGYVELAFRIMTNEDGAEAIHVIGESPLAAFFPTVIETHLGMLVQGPYRTTPSRETIPWADDWNRHLVEETAGRLVEALRDLRDRGLLGVHVFDALPLSRQRFAGGFFEPMFDAVHEAIRSEPLLPAHRGGPVSASQACLTDESGLRKLISRRQLAELLGEDEPVAWLAAEIAESATPALYRYLTSEHGVEEIDTSDLSELLYWEDEFLAAQTDAWTRRLYSFLRKERVRRQDLQGVPLIRLEDLTQVALAHGRGPDPFLPNGAPSDCPNTVRRAVCSSRPSLDFLKSLGLRQPDPIDDIVTGILPKYGEDGFTISDEEYAADLQRFLSAYAPDSRERRERLVGALRETPFVRVVNAGTGECSFVRPEAAYFATERLRALFDGVPSVLIVDRSTPDLRGAPMRSLLRDCGAQWTLVPVSISELREWEYEQLREMRREAGEERVGRRHELTNWHFRGLQELLDHMPRLPAEEAATRSELLWDALRETAERHSQRGFKALYAWSYYGNWSVEFDSNAVWGLNDEAWVPNNFGELQPPGSAEFAPLGWTPDPFLESVIKFREPEPHSSLATLADKEDVDAELLAGLIDVAKRGDLTPEDLQEFLDRRGRRSPREASGPQDGCGTSSGGGGDGDRRQSASHGPDGTVAGSGVTTGGATRGGWAADGGLTGGGVPAFRSRIGVERESEPTEEGSRERDRRMGVEEAAIAFIQKQEPSLQRTPTNNPGYDLYEPGTDGEPVRWVEVKALSGEWESNVTLSHTQFSLAREKGEAYWLYVVEHAGTEGARIVRIPNPAGRDSTYTFDHGWREAAEGASE